MFSSTAVEVAIGLAFLFLSLSVVASGVVNAVVWLTNRKGSELSKYLGDLLGQELRDQVLAHPLVTGLPDSSGTAKPPSYIPSGHFADAILQQLATDNAGENLVARVSAGISKLGDSALKKRLELIVLEVGTEADKLRGGVERWFDDSMARLSASYRARARVWMIGPALIAAFLVNADALSVARTLWTDDAVRAAVVAEAKSAVTTSSSTTTTTVKVGQSAATSNVPATTSTTQNPLDALANRVAKVKQLRFPVGWPSWSHRATDPRWPKDCGGWALKFIGLAITTLATSLGGPFWYDALRRLVGIKRGGS